MVGGKKTAESPWANSKDTDDGNTTRRGDFQICFTQETRYFFMYQQLKGLSFKLPNFRRWDIEKIENKKFLLNFPPKKNPLILNIKIYSSLS